MRPADGDGTPLARGAAGRPPGSIAAVALLAVALLAGEAARGAQSDPDLLWRELGEASAELSEARRVEAASLDIGPALLRLESGFWVSAQTPTGIVTERLFVGRGVVEVDVEDAVEGAQLRLFAGARPWVESFDRAVLVGLEGEELEGPSVSATLQLSEEQSDLVAALHRSWRESAERRLVGTDVALVARELGDAAAEHYRAVWLRTERRGWVMIELDPAREEAFSLGQFVPLELTEREQKKARRQLDRAHRRGRLRELTLAGLGTWDHWVSTRPAPGDHSVDFGADFEARHYDLRADIRPGDLELDGVVEIEAEAVLGGRRIVRLDLHPDLVVETVRDSSGRALPVRRSLDRLFLVLAEAPAPGERVRLEIEYSGTALETLSAPGRRAFVLVDTLYWYPHVGVEDLASYELELSWPRRFELFAPGERLDGGERSGNAWLRHRVETPTKGVSFEIGRFETVRTEVDGLEILLARDRLSGSVLHDEEALLQHVVDALRFLQERFGPLPWRQLTVVTAPRHFSQSLQGFVTLSTTMMVDDVAVALAGGEDPRTVIAHELAHQWWGHVVTWGSYRDLWLSEALASYSALLYARRGLESRGPWAGPVSGWEEELLEPTAGGDAVEAMGPLVIGDRLNSSRANAWSSVAYLKGPLVLDLLAREIGEDAMVGLLRGLALDGPARIVDTAELLGAMTAVAGRSLAELTDALVYGTGLPRYEFTVREIEGVEIRVGIEEVPDLRVSFTIDNVDVDGVAVPEVKRVLEEAPLVLPRSEIFVPYELWLLDESTLPATGKGRKWRETVEQARREGNVREVGWLRLRPGRTELRLEHVYELRRLVLDPGGEVPAVFDSVDDNRKRALLESAMRSRAAGDDPRAEQLLHRSLAAIDVAVWEEPGAFDEARRILDVRSRAELARLALDHGRESLAADHLEAARRRADGAPGWLREVLDDVIETQQWRLWLREGRCDDVVAEGRSRLGGPDEPGTEGLLLLAAAALREGRAELVEQVLARPAVRESRVLGVERLFALRDSATDGEQ